MAMAALQQRRHDLSDAGGILAERRLFAAAAEHFAALQAGTGRGRAGLADQVAALRAQSEVALAAGALAEAEAAARAGRALARRSGRLGAEAARIALQLAATLEAQGRFTEALSWVSRALRDSERAAATAGRTAERIAGRAALVRARCEAGLERWEAAKASFEQAAALLAPIDARGQAEALVRLGRVARLRRDVQGAWATLNRALSLLQGEHSTLVAAVHAELGHLCAAEGDCPAAIQHGGQALEWLWLSSGMVDKAELAGICELFGRVCAALGDRHGATTYLQRAVTYLLQANRWREARRVQIEAARAKEAGDAPAASHGVGCREKRMLKGYQAVFGLLDTLEGLSPECHRRATYVAHYALLLASTLDCDGEERLAVSHAARFYEIGRTTAEACSGCEAALLGEKVLSLFGLPVAAGRAVRHVGERFDGRGQPDRLRGREIPRPARLIAVCDVYVRAAQAVGMLRPGGHSAGVSALLANAGTRLDPELVDAFLTLHAVA
ncbi:MAG TPA: HD domain-containing phosphohydrolase [Limnochordia bacterium]